MNEKKKKLSPLAWVLILSSAFLAVFLIVSGVMFMSGKQSMVSDSAGSSFLTKEVIGVVELNGVIMDSKRLLQKLEKFEKNDKVKAVVLRLNSPGGSVAPSQEIYEAVKNYKKPLVVSMGSVAASGAFYIACGAKKVFANPGTLTGSIGVIMEFVNLSKLYDWAKIQRYALKTGKYKGSGAEYREMTEEEKTLLQGMIDNVLVQFKTAVMTGRKLTAEQVDKIADGRIMSGQQAKAEKLIDELGTLKDAIDGAAKLAGIKGEPKVIYPAEPRRRLIDFLMDNQDEDAESISHTAGVSGILRSIVSGLMGTESQTSLQNHVTGFEPGIYWLWSAGR